MDSLALRQSLLACPLGVGVPNVSVIGLENAMQW